ncbi:hypothetical protein GVAV_000501 [Gurleya vavrai]
MIFQKLSTRSKEQIIAGCICIICVFQIFIVAKIYILIGLFVLCACLRTKKRKAIAFSGVFAFYTLKYIVSNKKHNWNILAYFDLKKKKDSELIGNENVENNVNEELQLQKVEENTEPLIYHEKKFFDNDVIDLVKKNDEIDRSIDKINSHEKANQDNTFKKEINTNINNSICDQKVLNHYYTEQQNANGKKDNLKSFDDSTYSNNGANKENTRYEINSDFHNIQKHSIRPDDHFNLQIGKHYTSPQQYYDLQKTYQNSSLNDFDYDLKDTEQNLDRKNTIPNNLTYMPYRQPENKYNEKRKKNSFCQNQIDYILNGSTNEDNDQKMFENQVFHAVDPNILITQNRQCMAAKKRSNQNIHIGKRHPNNLNHEIKISALNHTDSKKLIMNDLHFNKEYDYGHSIPNSGSNQNEQSDSKNESLNHQSQKLNMGSFQKNDKCDGNAHICPDLNLLGMKLAQKTCKPLNDFVEQAKRYEELRKWKAYNNERQIYSSESSEISF